MNGNWTRVAPITFMYDQAVPEGPIRDDISGKIRTFYFNDEEVNYDTRIKLAHAYSDRWFNGPIETEAYLHVQHQSPTYLYRFIYKGERSYLEKYSNQGNLGK